MKLHLARCLLGFVVIGMLGGISRAHAGEQESQLEAILVWGTNDEEVSDPNLKPVDAGIARKLNKLPFKWDHYYEVERKQLAVAEGKSKTVRMSEQCEIVVRNMGGNTIELGLRGEGNLVGNVTQALPEGELLITGGNAENLTAWFVVLKRVN